MISVMSFENSVFVQTIYIKPSQIYFETQGSSTIFRVRNTKQSNDVYAFQCKNSPMKYMGKTGKTVFLLWSLSIGVRGLILPSLREANLDTRRGGWKFCFRFVPLMTFYWGSFVKCLGGGHTESDVVKFLRDTTYSAVSYTHLTLPTIYSV